MSLRMHFVLRTCLIGTAGWVLLDDCYSMFKVTVCLKCGGEGFSVELVYCEKCQDYAMHWYCLDVPPTSPNQSVSWFCEDCEPEVEITCSSSSSKLLDSKEMQANKSREGKKKTTKDADKFAAEKEVQICEGNPSLRETHCSGNYYKDQKFTKEWKLVVKEKEAESLQTSPIAVSDLNASSMERYDCYVQSQPIIDPIWRGKLCMRNNFNTVDRLAVVAHLSTLACTKVHETAKLLPELLFLELTHRSRVWPKSFENLGPSNHDIALYFFPDSIRVENIFDVLVDEMIQQNLAMRAVLENAELLIFPSTVLPMQHWRFQTKFYLWGVFRRKQNSHPAGDVVPKSEKSLALARYRHSPISPLSNIGSYDYDSVP
ncbi:hypothetical protein FEM48_Zijuj06G0194900 [Ziziphus jujuba var. spinosa]|uniref:Zinc finger PHD-type domain-containing protein n=1 Tax=Ziziphus jujuba var. spinosa TaxID=714518 RepID=A0A978VB69_ZIZJJ|nr:hypothetical protein FEM48_Zijuj06G0194900 [Ziziphus jujuba var. spinosa]